MNKMINEIMEIHAKDVCLFKVGTFYHAYGKDACVMAYLFDYKIKELGDNHKECGFPIGAVNKVTAKLQNASINYLLIDRRNDYAVDEKEDYKENNKYQKVYEKAHKYVNCRKRIDNINQFLEENIEAENITKILAKMEELFMKAEKFKVIEYIRQLILAVDKELDNFPKKDIELKNRIRTASYDLLELAYEANTSEDIAFKKIQITKMISRVKIIDFLLNLSLDKTLITQKKFYKLVARIDDIIKYTTGWLKSLQ